MLVHMFLGGLANDILGKEAIFVLNLTWMLLDRISLWTDPDK